MRKRKLKMVQLPGCKGWYIRPTEAGKTKSIFLSHSKLEAERVARDYDKQRAIKRIEGYNPHAGTDLVIEKYLRDKFSTTLTTKKSRARYNVVIRRFQGFLREKLVRNISEITTETVWGFLSGRNELISNKTWNIERMIISNLCKYCLDHEWAIKNPVSKIPTKKMTDPQVEHLDERETKILLEYMKGKGYKVPYYELIAAIVYTGMRVNEAIHLTKRDVNLARGLIVIREKVIEGIRWTPKTKQQRYVPVPDEIRGIIRQQLRTEGELLFKNTNGKLLQDRKVLDRLKTCCKKAGLKEVHVHSLRHSFTSIATEKRIAAEVIQGVLGHKSDSMTRRYRHMSPDFLRKEFKDFKYGADETTS
ncbi:MAG: phage integrase family protein [PVC group bacterium]|nr:phage integrase family protein [PVC group bacterium]